MEEVGREGVVRSLVDLETENQQLKERIERYEKQLLDQTNGAVSDQLTQLKEGSDRISDQIRAYAPIAEDVWGLRVFEKAKSYLIGWITLGGVTALLASIAVFAEVWKYAVDLIDLKVKALSEKEVTAIVQKETEGQVARYFKEQNEEYIIHVEQLTQESVRRLTANIQSTLGYGLPQAIARREQPDATVTSVMADYTQQMGAVRDQGMEGSAVSFAIAYALEYQVLRTTGQRVRLSPREIYNLARAHENTTNMDTGTRINDAVKVVETEGAILDEVWPYRSGEFSAKPPNEFAMAARYKVKRVSELNEISQIKAALLITGPIVAGITVYESFLQDNVAKDGMVPLPKPKEKIIGGHAICIVGYDDKKNLFKFINSWGSNWGDKGYGYLPYSYITDNSNDIWSLSMQ